VVEHSLLNFDAAAWLASLDGARGVFVTGTDTEVGKTHVSTALIRSLARAGVRVAGMKPVAAGSVSTGAGARNEDALALAAAANVGAPYHAINPYCLEAAVSPHLAAADEGVTIDTSVIRESFETLIAQSADFVVVEGAGGWLAPIGEAHTMADIAIALDLPVVLVVGLRLGCLNHSLLTRRAIDASGLRFAGWIGNRIDPHFQRAEENITTLERLLAGAAFDIVPHQCDSAAGTC
jgi:dethiobiotin synthetase